MGRMGLDVEWESVGRCRQGRILTLPPCNGVATSSSPFQSHTQWR
jgi:hypothetical protein